MPSTMSEPTTTRDPYRRCETDCTHDLARGVLVSDLLGGEFVASVVAARAALTGERVADARRLAREWRRWSR